MKKHGKPSVGELVVCKIVKIFPNSAYAELVEYDGLKGMIHVSEVALRWVRNIREFLKLNQYVVCKVMRVEGDNISLSVKRVRKVETESKLNEFKRERKAEKLLEIAAKSLGKTLDDAYKEVGLVLQEEFGSLHKAFDIAVKNPGLLKDKGVPDSWAKAITEIAAKSHGEKTYEITAELELICYAPNGIKVIKDAIISATKGKNIEAKYISAPKYMLISKGKNAKKLHALVEKAAEDIVKHVNKCRGNCTCKIIEA